MTPQEFKALETAYDAAFIASLRCDCKNRLTRKGCQHAQACERARLAWYAAFPLMGKVAPDQR